jgi:hypothetical protein
MGNLGDFLKKCFKPGPWPPVLEQYLEYVNSLEFHTDPDYNALRSRTFCGGLRPLECSPKIRLI